MARWVFVCENCGKEWPLTDKGEIIQHEWKQRVSVYQQKKNDLKKEPKESKRPED